MLDTVGFQHPAIVGNGQSGPAAIHFSATHPERVSALVLVNTYGHYLKEDDYPWGFHRQDLDVTVARGAILDTAAGLDLLARSRPAWETAQAEANVLIGGPGVAALREIAERLGLGTTVD